MSETESDGLRVIVAAAACGACTAPIKLVSLLPVRSGKHAAGVRIMADAVRYPADDRCIIVHHRCDRRA